MVMVTVKVMVMAITRAIAKKTYQCPEKGTDPSLYTQNIDNFYYRTLNSLRGFINDVTQILRFSDPVFVWRHLRMIPKWMVKNIEPCFFVNKNSAKNFRPELFGLKFSWLLSSVKIWTKIFWNVNHWNVQVTISKIRKWTRTIVRAEKNKIDSGHPTRQKHLQ